VATVLEEHRVDYQAVFEQLSMKSTNPNAGMGFTEDDEEDEEDMNMSRSSRTGGAGSASAAQAASRKPSNDTPVLDNFGTDMTRAAEEGKLDPVVGRVKEIERLAQILSRRKKNNPILIGEPGVGKSAIVEGLALRIVEKKVSRILFDKRVIALDMTAVVAGTKYRGQFEERIRSILNELQKNPNVILRSEEHTSELQSRFDLVCRLLLEKKNRDRRTREVEHTPSVGGMINTVNYLVNAEGA